MVTRQIAHLDLDAFYVSVERLVNPSLCGKPVIVGGAPGQRGVVASASYEARAYGVKSAMPMAQALRRCPQAVYVIPRHRLYEQYSKTVIALLEAYTPLVEQLSIDEAFLDLTGCETLWGPASEVVAQIQRRIREEIGLPCSIGLATSKIVAKIACSLAKPEGLMIVPPGKEAEFLAPLPIQALWGVGQVMARKLAALGIETIGDLAVFPEGELVRLFGEWGRQAHQAAQGVDHSPVTPQRERRSISQERTFARDVSNERTICRLLLAFCDHLAARLRGEASVAQTLSLKLRYADFETITRQTTLPQPTDQGEILYRHAVALLQMHWNRSLPLRLVGVSVSGLITPGGYQLDLFDHQDQRRARLNKALDEIRARYGPQAIMRASLLSQKDPHSQD